MKRFIPCVDVLENRDLKTVSLVEGTLFIGGDPPPSSFPEGVSIVSVANSGPSVVVDWNGTVSEFDAASVQRIDFEGNPTQYFEVFTNATPLASAARGGDGVNIFTASGGGANTFIGGNDWNQFVDTADGIYDAFVGGDGFNYFFAGTHTNVLIGGRGVNFVIYGGNDNTIGLVDEAINFRYQY